MANQVTIVTALLAAGFWFWSAKVRIPNLLETPMSGKGSITDILKHQSQLSAVAAVFAALSAMAQAVDLYMKNS